MLLYIYEIYEVQKLHDKGANLEIHNDQNIHENKKALRTRCREIVKGLTPEYIEGASRKIADLILATGEYKTAKTIFCYMSMGGEPVTDAIIERALEDGKRVGIPLCVGPHEMVVKEYKCGDELARGAFGIREPLAEAAEITADEFDLAIVPCVACSKDGRRIGHGAGYYDRFLGASGFYKIALCFEKLIADDIPLEETDVYMDGVATEDAIYGTRWRG